MEEGASVNKKRLLAAFLIAFGCSILTWLANGQNKFVNVYLQPIADLWNFLTAPITVSAYFIVWRLYPGEFPLLLMLVLIFVEWFILALFVMVVWAKLSWKKRTM